MSDKPKEERRFEVEVSYNHTTVSTMMAYIDAPDEDAVREIVKRDILSTVEEGDFLEVRMVDMGPAPVPNELREPVEQQDDPVGEPDQNVLPFPDPTKTKH